MTSAAADAVVVGAGPAGRALARRLADHGLDVTLVDPAPGRPWPATYACWADEVPPWVSDEVVAVRVEGVRVTVPHPVDIRRPYTVFETAALQRFLSAAPLRVRTARAVGLTGRSVTLTDGTRIDAGIVIDARGAPSPGPRQTAYGIVVDRRAVAAAVGDAGAVLMDWRRPRDVSWSWAPSFLYAVPLGADRFLLEETCLAGHPPLAVGELRGRLTDRLTDLFGGQPPEPLADERVSFPVVGIPAPWRSQTLAYGGRAGLTHPATGYSVAASLAAADTVAAAIAAGRDPTRALWPRTARTVRRLRLVGLDLLLALDHSDTADFFAAFFALPPGQQRAYLSDRTDVSGTTHAMWSVLRNAPPRLRATIARRATPALLRPVRR